MSNPEEVLQHLEEQASRPVSFTLPWPPSVNHYWGVKGKRRFVTKKGLDFRASVHAILLTAKCKCIADNIKVTLHAYPPDNRRRDLDNLFKATFDALEHGGLFEDDSQIKHIDARMFEKDKERPRLKLKIEMIKK